MKSVYLRNFVATATLVTVSFLLTTLAFIGIARSYIINDYQTTMESSAGEVARLAAAVADYDGLHSWSLSMNLSTIANSTGNHIFITDDGGEIVCCSDGRPSCDHIGRQLPESVTAMLSQNGTLRLLSSLGTLYGERRYVVAQPIAGRDGGLLGYVFVTCASANMFGAWETFLGIAVLVAIVVFALALVISLFYSKRMARPLDEMASASRKFARGDFSVRVKQVEDPTDEMGALIESFNKMADSLEMAEERRSEFIANISHELRTPMTTISGFADGILDGTIPPDQEKKYLRSISDETKRLSRLVREMLDVSPDPADHAELREPRDEEKPGRRSPAPREAHPGPRGPRRDHAGDLQSHRQCGEVCRKGQLHHDPAVQGRRKGLRLRPRQGRDDPAGRSALHLRPLP